jgi:hypothetical protein
MTRDARLRGGFGFRTEDGRRIGVPDEPVQDQEPADAPSRGAMAPSSGNSANDGAIPPPTLTASA